MKDPNACKQPKFVGDRFYVPSVSVGNDYNDNVTDGDVINLEEADIS